MFEELKKYLNDYSKEIDEQPQEYDKSLRDLWERNAELALNVLTELNVVRLPSRKLKNILHAELPSPVSDKKSFSTLCSQMEIIYNRMELIDKYEQSFRDCPRGYSLDALKSILSENYKPPEEIEDTLKHLLTLHYLYAYLMPTNPGLSHVISLRAGYALALLTGNALIKSFIADDKGFEADRFADHKKANDKKAKDMLGLISQATDGLTINKYRTPDGKIKYYSMAAEIQTRFKKDEELKKQLAKISKRYKNGTKIPDEETIVKYLKEINRGKSEKVTF